MTWTLLTIIAIGIFVSLVLVSVRLGLLERHPVTYTSTERLAWAILFAAIPSIGGGNWRVGIAFGAAMYFSGPEYYQYRIKRVPIHHAG